MFVIIMAFMSLMYTLTVVNYKIKITDLRNKLNAQKDECRKKHIA